MRSRVLRITKLLVIVLISLTIVTVIGCKKKTETTTPDVPEAQAKEIEQTVCPVMAGNPINKNVFVEYQGKKVYFCCNDCKAKFNADPEKYLDKLPQFRDEMESMKEQAEQTADEMKKAADKMPDIE